MSGGAWRIADWDKFENSRSRGVRYCQFVAVPLVLDDVRYARLMRQPDGAACFGVFIALVQWHMRFGGEVRSGWLTDDGTEYGEPLTVDDLAAYLKMDDVTVSVALDALGSPAVGWLQGPCRTGAEPVLDCVRKSALLSGGREGGKSGLAEDVEDERFNLDFTEPVRSCGRSSVLAHAGGTGDREQRTEKEGDVVGVSRDGRVRGGGGGGGGAISRGSAISGEEGEGGPTTPADAGGERRRTEDGRTANPRHRATTPPPAAAGETGTEEGEGRATPPPSADAGDREGREETEEERRTSNAEHRTQEGERSAPGEGGSREIGSECESQPHPREASRRWAPEEAALVEIPCRDGVFYVPIDSLNRYVFAYPDVDVTAQLLRMQDWAFSKIEAGGIEAEKAWSQDVAPAGVTGWLAEEQKKAEDRAQGLPVAGVGARGRGEDGGRRTENGGRRAGSWQGKIESLDKQKRAIKAQIDSICAKYRFNDEYEGRNNRDKRPVAWAKVQALRGEIEAINAAMSAVKREA